MNDTPTIKSPPSDRWATLADKDGVHVLFRRCDEHGEDEHGNVVHWTKATPLLREADAPAVLRDLRHMSDRQAMAAAMAYEAAHAAQVAHESVDRAVNHSTAIVIDSGTGPDFGGAA